VFLASWPPRDVVVTPGRASRVSGLILLALLCPLFGVVEPGVGELLRQIPFSLSEALNEGAELGAAPRTGIYGAGSAKGGLLATLALEGEVGRMPLVGLAERHFVALIVRLDALDDLLLPHGLLPFLPRLFGRAFPPVLGRYDAEA
jgi:hypothetical protein